MSRMRHPTLAVATLALLVAGGDAAASGLTALDREWWAIRPLADPPVPEVSADGPARPRGPVDGFVLARLRASGIEPAPEANRETLIRRLSLDLLGIPPTPDEVEAFVSDPSPDAWERLVDRVLASPRHGEHAGRQWLDLVRYADSDGFRADGYRSNAWRYRDWVVRAFNGDMPYDRFTREQIAGDEVAPDDPAAFIATGYLRHWPYEWNQRDVHRQWDDILNDITDITGEVFLGVGIQCARCHDHKFDPILQRDYFGLRAFFSAILPRRDLVAATAKQREEHARQLAIWEDATAAIREEIETIERPHREKLERTAFEKFTDEIKRVLTADPAVLSPHDLQIRHLAERQLEDEHPKVAGAIKGDERKRWESLREKLAEFDRLKPRPLPSALAVVDVGPSAPPMTIPGTDERVDPGFLAVLDQPPPAISSTRDGCSTGRRLAVADWLARDDNQLALRVIANRVWQQLFGIGIVATSNDFGRRGAAPSHPELLDWLAHELVRRDRSLKSLRREILVSSAYRRASLRPATGAEKRLDPQNRLVWRQRVRRVAAEELRDAMLAVSGEIDLAMGGPGTGDASTRRSVYLKVMRNSPAEMLETFDGPDHFNSCARRNVTTTAPQALLLMNGDWVMARARAFARRVERSAAEDAARVDLAWRLALGRTPSREEVQGALDFLDRQAGLAAPEGAPADRAAAWVDLCHVLLNANEFLYVD